MSRRVKSDEQYLLPKYISNLLSMFKRHTRRNSGSHLNDGFLKQILHVYISTSLNRDRIVLLADNLHITARLQVTYL